MLFFWTILDKKPFFTIKLSETFFFFLKQQNLLIYSYTVIWSNKWSFGELYKLNNKNK